MSRNDAPGARRSRRFNWQSGSGLDISCAVPRWTLKRAKARAPLPTLAARVDGHLKKMGAMWN
jgi:hypothetical protein